jgi:diacylglycerol kinase
MLRHAISFKHAFAGIWTAVTTQTNMRIHFLVGSLVLLMAVLLQIDFDHILDLILTIMVVMTAEMVNTSLEFMSDAITLEKNPYIKAAKDVSAGAVLIAAIFAILVGLIVFIPKIITFLHL